MAQKNETATLVLALLITLGLVGGGTVWLMRRSGAPLGGLLQPTSQKNSDSRSDLPPAVASQPGSKLQGFADVQNIPSGSFKYGGSTSWAPLRLTVDSAVQAARPEFQLRYLGPDSGSASSGSGIRMLINDRLAFAQSSRPILESEANKAEQQGKELKQIPVAIDGIAVAVNPGLNLPGLTLAQLKAIYTGQTTNWNQVGGPNLSITPYTRPTNSGGTVELFVEDVLGGQTFGPTVEFVSTTTQAIRKLAEDPGGVYFASAPEVVPQCTIKPLPLSRQGSSFIAPYQEPLVTSSQCPAQRNRLNTDGFQQGQYPLIRNLYVVIQQNGQAEEKAGEAYTNFLLTEEGQNLIARAGFVRIR
ncbi:substrate-binding domain-containing protein [Trichocoleus sp. FACHB-591]|uniref:PstS family phosphate ABC transporter substrate-binding protein n=1 Tax=Trichocoleus sp. FACHB-591 TaxID=2692872 RepID=UPI0016869386|nr:substrate-binding domain-containing protein [Trichocoleus sp. FACHB-591]MBD2095354.1 substrate-binding domain-containing protein [Trichocoleus sp. FACHB-591]